MVQERHSDENVIGAFSEEHAERLTGVSVHQLRHWDRLGFLVPSYAAENRRSPYSRVYSFRDIVSLRVLNALRNEKGLPLQHLKQVAKKLARIDNADWSNTTLYVLGKKVVFDNPETSKREEIVSGQGVFDIPLQLVISNARQAVRDMNRRADSQAGKLTHSKFISNNEIVFAGTRISAESVERYLEAGFSDREIIAEFPDLTPADIAVVRKRSGSVAA
jgi:DNA-binding transcriptional MerR regulator